MKRLLSSVGPIIECFRAILFRFSSLKNKAITQLGMDVLRKTNKKISPLKFTRLNNLSYLLLFIWPVFFIGCGSDESNIDIGTSTYEVDPVFEPYVQEFIEEGRARGKTIDFGDTGLRIEFSDVALESAAGFCYLGEHHIVINKENWYRYSERFRSYLLFHELGHCELDRRHKNDQFEDGIWKSIMRGDPLVGLQTRVPTPYFGFRKDYYLDELFEPNTPEPAWSRVAYQYDLPLNKELLVSADSINKINERFDVISENYEFEVDFTLSLAANARTRLEWGTGDAHYFLYIVPNWGYYIGVHLDQADNELFYSNNLTLVNGKPIEKVTVRQHEGMEQIFINEQFIFHIDPLSAVNYIKLEATNGGQIITNFDVKNFEFYQLKE